MAVEKGSGLKTEGLAYILVTCSYPSFLSERPLFMASVSTIHRQTYLASSQPPCDTEDRKHTAKLDVTLEYGYCICMLTGGN